MNVWDFLHPALLVLSAFAFAKFIAWLFKPAPTRQVNARADRPPLSTKPPDKQPTQVVILMHRVVFEEWQHSVATKSPCVCGQAGYLALMKRTVSDHMDVNSHRLRVECKCGRCGPYADTRDAAVYGWEETMKR